MTKMFASRFAQLCFLSASPLALVVAAAPAAAQAQTRAFDIPAQPLSSAVLEFSRQADVMVVLPPELAAGKRSAAVKGSLSVNAAIAQLLRRTGLRAMPNAAGGYRVAPFAEGRGAARAESSTASSGEESEIIVTAQKREQRLIETPQAISVLSDKTLNKLGAVQFRDFANTVPGLSYTTQGPGWTQLALRGVTTGFDSGPSVGIYVDDVPFGASSALSGAATLTLDVGLFDINRIEVLRGPQGTLYGASTMGGLIKYVSKQPNTSAFSADLQTGVSATEHGGVSYNGAVTINAPLSADKAALRASAFYSHDGGYIDNLQLSHDNVNRGRVYGGRLDLLLAPAEALEVRIGAFAQNIHRDGTSFADISAAGVPIDGRLDQRRAYDEPFEQRFRLVSGTVKYDFGPAELTSISSYQTVRSQYFIDLTALYVPIFTPLGPPYSNYSAYGWINSRTTKKFTQEIRLTSKGNSPLQWLIGAFYTNEKVGDDQYFVVRGLAGQPLPDSIYTFDAPSKYREYAAFGNLTYHITDKFDVSGGIRYAKNKQNYTQNGTGLIGSTPPVSSRESVVTYLANATYKFTSHATAYVRFATGYRPGGPNYFVLDATTGQTFGSPNFEADRLKSYEAGIKFETDDRRYGADLAAYYIDWDNIQVSSFRGGFSVIANAPGGATVRGGEATLFAKPIEGLSLVGTLAYQDGHLSEADPDLRNTKGERLPTVPRFTASALADYQFTNTGLRPSVGVTVRHVSNRTASFNQSFTPQYRLPAYTTFDLRSAVAIGSINAQLFVRNVFDKRAQLSALTSFSGGGGPYRLSIAQPRTFGMMLTSSF